MGSDRYEISVTYLIWIPLGVDVFQKFVASYKKYNAGINHHLILLFNGANDLNAANPFHEIAREFDLCYDSFYKKAGLDLEAYFWLAKQCDSSYFLFLNSFSLILDSDWLSKLMTYTKDPKVGLISPSGSYQSHFDSVFFNNSWKWDRSRSLKVNYLKYKLLIKAFFYWRFLFPSFPNPHIRTNAFLISRNLFLSLKMKRLRNKFTAYQFESGYKSMTRQILKKGYDVLVVDKSGRAYKIGEWSKANIFWKANQEDLLIADKQTEYYKSSNDREKSQLRESAWGKNS